MERRDFLVNTAGVTLGTALATGMVGAEPVSSNDGTTAIGFSENETGVPNGAWTWFNSERAVVDPDESRILVGSVSSGGSNAGDIVVLWYDVDTDETGHFVLHEGLQEDDHNDPALWVRPDGRYLAMYGGHFLDNYNRWRVTTNPHDPTSWEPEQTFESEAAVTYSNIHHLPNDNGGNGRTYNFTRTNNWDPNVLVSTDQGSTFSYGGRLLQRGGTGDRPYPRYDSDDTRIHVAVTEEHPRQFDTSIYHGYVEDGTLYDSFGTVLKSNVLDGDADAPGPTDLTTVFDVDNDAGGVMNRAWTTDVAIDGNGNTVVLFTTRHQDDWQDHRFFYGHFDGSSWTVNEMAAAGPGLYDGEKDYTGLGSIDPDQPWRVVISTPVDPRDGSSLSNWELFLGTTGDWGATWGWEALTPNASVDNLRPVFPSWNASESALVWMHGVYTDYQNWETNVVGMAGDIGPVSFPDTIPEGTYRITNVNSGKVLDVSGGSTEDGADVIQWDYHGGTNQQWDVLQNADGTYRIENVNSGKVLDVSGGGTADGDNIIQWDWWGGDNQKWNIVDNGDGTYRLENVNSGKVADVSGQSTSDGASVIQWAWWGGDNQKWTFDAV